MSVRSRVLTSDRSLCSRCFSKLIGKVMEQDAPFAGVLRDLADKYEYDALIQLLQEPLHG